MNDMRIATTAETQSMISYLRDHGVEAFWHFTDSSNLASIARQGALYSWWHCQQNHITIPRAGGNETSHALDCRYDLQDFVRLSFNRDHPMQHSRHLRNHRFMLLRISLNVLRERPVCFTDMNATKTGHHLGTGLNMLRRIDLAGAQRTGVRFVSRDMRPIFDPKNGIDETLAFI